MKTQKKSIIAFAVFAASAIVAVGAPLAQSTFATQKAVCELNASTGAVEKVNGVASTDCKLTNQVQVNVGEVLTIEVVQDLIQLDPVVGQTKGEATANEIANGDSASTNVIVSTNWADGANLNVTMNSSVQNLVGAKQGNSTVIAPTTKTTLTDPNTWGYYAYNTSGTAPTTPTWAGMPASGSTNTIFNGSNTGAGMDSAGSTTWNFVYGATIDYTTPADAYSGTILYTAATN
jgi:hypothetical protein